MLSDAYIFDDAVIGAGSVIEQSIIGNGVKIGESSRIARGSLVGDGVVLGKSARLGPFERVSRRKADIEREVREDEERDEDSEDEEWEEVERSTCHDMSLFRRRMR